MISASTYLKELFIAAAAFAAGYTASLSGNYALSGSVLILAAIYIALYQIIKSGKLLEPAAFFALSWIGGTGVSALKLSYLQSEWSNASWISFFLAYVFFIAGCIAAQYIIKTDIYTGAFIKSIRGSSSLYQDKPEPGRSESDNSKPNSAELSSSESNSHDINSLFPDRIETESPKKDRLYKSFTADGLFIAINIVMLLSLGALLTEAVILGYIPLFTTDTPHAYSYFHVSGLHYFTVSCVLVPSLTLIYFYTAAGLSSEISCAEGSTDKSSFNADPFNRKTGSDGSADKAQDSFVKKVSLLNCRSLWLILCTAASLIIPILLVSRYQLIFAVMLTGMTYLSLNRGRLPSGFSKKHIFAAAAVFAVLAVLYVFITYERAHSIEYLNGIFEMKNTSTPIFITQPYMYIANNFDNFNCLTNELSEHTYGLKMLFPLFALTGMKFTHPELVSFPLYVTKEELTTVTLFYDAYYDFGIIGVCALAFVLGILLTVLMRYIDERKNRDISVVFIYAQLSFYILFAFFTTWFSNPTTWFYFVAVIAIGIFIKIYVYAAMRIKYSGKYLNRDSN